MEVVEERDTRPPLKCECGEVVKVYLDKETHFFCQKCGFDQLLARDFETLNTDFLDQNFNWERSLQTLLVTCRNLALELQSLSARPKEEDVKELQEKLSRSEKLVYRYELYAAYLAGAAVGGRGLKKADLERYKP